MEEVTAELPMLALIFTRKLRPMIIGSVSGWLTLAGMIARPRATSSRTNSGVDALAQRDELHLRRHLALARVVHLRDVAASAAAEHLAAAASGRDRARSAGTARCGRTRRGRGSTEAAAREAPRRGRSSRTGPCTGRRCRRRAAAGSARSGRPRCAWARARSRGTECACRVDPRRRPCESRKAARRSAAELDGSASRRVLICPPYGGITRIRYRGLLAPRTRAGGLSAVRTPNVRSGLPQVESIADRRRRRVAGRVIS